MTSEDYHCVRYIPSHYFHVYAIELRITTVSVSVSVCHICSAHPCLGVSSYTYKWPHLSVALTAPVHTNTDTESCHANVAARHNTHPELPVPPPTFRVEHRSHHGWAEPYHNLHRKHHTCMVVKAAGAGFTCRLCICTAV